MKKYYVSYRNEFATEIEAESPEQAIHKVESNSEGCDWKQTGELHRCFFEIIDEE